MKNTQEALAVLSLGCMWIFVPVSYVLAPSQDEGSFFASLSQVFVSGFLLLFLVRKRHLITITHSTVAAWVFLLYACVRQLLVVPADLSVFGTLLFPFFGYYGLKTLFREGRIPVNRFLFSGTWVNLLLFLFCTVAFFLPGAVPPDNLFRRNPSLFAILLAAEAVFLSAWFVPFRIRQHRLFPVLPAAGTGLAAVFLLAASGGRAGWIGGVGALVFLVARNRSLGVLNRGWKASASAAVLLLLWGLIRYKPGSSNGRLLIYKVSAEMLKDHWLWGIGCGRFKAVYNRYQAAYFSTHNLNGPEAMLADNSYYAFNDGYQLLLEQGIAGFLLFAAACTLWIRNVVATAGCGRCSPLFWGACASLICIGTAALFSYPFQVFPLLFQAIVCAALIRSFPEGAAPDLSPNRMGGKLARGTLPVLGLAAFLYALLSVSFWTKSLQAERWQRTGFHQQALQAYAELARGPIKDGAAAYGYAQELYRRNELAKAAKVLEEAKRYAPSSHLYRLSARVRQELGEDQRAEQDYQTAVFMVPKRMVSRYELLQFYREQNDTAAVLSWCGSILRMPVKVPSPVTGGIRRDVALLSLRWQKKGSRNGALR